MTSDDNYKTNQTLAVTVDFEKYVHHLDGMDLTEAEQAQLLQTLWNIACEFMLLGFDIHPVQQVQKACGKSSVSPEYTPITGENEVSSLGQFIKENIAEYSDPKTDQTGESV